MPLRDQFVICPRCNGGLDPVRFRMICAVCRAQLVPESEFLDQISGEQATALLRPRGFLDAADSGHQVAFLHELPAGAVPATPVACPRCTVAMSRHLLWNVAVDRCAVHGVWVGEPELRAIIEAATAGL